MSEITQILNSINHGDPDATGKLLTRIVQLYEAWDRPDNTNVWRKARRRAAGG